LSTVSVVNYFVTPS